MILREYSFAAGYQTEMATMPVGATIVSVAKKAGDARVTVVAQVDPKETKTEHRKFKCLKAGQHTDNIPETKLSFIGTVDVAGVLNHVHEVFETAPAEKPKAPVEDKKPSEPTPAKDATSATDDLNLDAAAKK